MKTMGAALATFIALGAWTHGAFAAEEPAVRKIAGGFVVQPNAASPEVRKFASGLKIDDLTALRRRASLIQIPFHRRVPDLLLDVILREGKAR